ncbi:MAG: TonB-dependent receptor [Pseudomonadota bacterium]
MARGSEDSTAKHLLLSMASAMALTAAAPAVAIAQTVAAQSETKAVDIPAGPLGETIAALILEYDVNIIVREAMVEGKRAPAVAGDLSAEEAVAQAFSQSGLTLSQTDSGAYVAQRDESVSSQMAADEIVVTANREYLYRAENAKTFGINLPLKDLPITVNVLTEDFIEDTAALEIQDLIAFVPGVTAGEEGGGVGHGVNIRGFENEIRLVNGSRQNLDITRSVMTTELFERVEIVKGPAGAEVGVADGGGLINYITKKPQSQFAAEFFAGIGDFGYRRIGGDVTGPITQDGKLRYRFIGAYTELQEWRAGTRDNTPFYNIAPSIAWDYIDSGTITFEYTRFFSNRPRDRGIYYLEGAEFTGSDSFAPREYSVRGGDNFEFNRVQGNRFDLNINQKIGDYLTIDITGQKMGLTADQRTLDFPILAGSFVSDNVYLGDEVTWNGVSTDIIAGGQENSGDNEMTSIRAELQSQFSAGPISNSLKAGYEYYRGRQLFLGLERLNGLSLGFVLPRDLFTVEEPVTADVLDDPGTLTFPQNLTRQDIQTISSVYGQWIGQFANDLRIIAGVRLDSFENSRARPTVPGDETTLADADIFQDFEQVSFRIAGSYSINSDLSVFAGYSNSYNGQNGVTADQDFIEPLRNTSIEVGAKTELFDGRVLWSNTLYQITQGNIAAPDPNDLTGQFVIPFGEARVRGFESEFIGSITDYLDLSAGLSWQDSEVLEAENANTVGNKFPNVPNFSANMFANYNFGQLGLYGASGRIGLSHVGEREGNTVGLFQLPSYTRIDVGARYIWNEALTLDLYVENLFDKTYYRAADGFRSPPQNGINPGDRRLVRFNVSYRF